MKPILAADDCPVLQRVVPRVLGSLGISCVMVKDGREAVSEVHSHGSDFMAVLLDVDMPHMDGIAAAVEIRRAAPDLPILFLTASDLETVMRRLPRGFRAEFLMKPFRISELADAISGLLGVAQS